MKTKNKLGRGIFAAVCFATLFFLTSCSSSGVDSAAANQVLTNSNSHQQYALYLFEDGRITVNKTLTFYRSESVTCGYRGETRRAISADQRTSASRVPKK